MNLVNEVKARRERLGMTVVRAPMVSPEVAAKVREARERRVKTATVDARKPKEVVVVPEPEVPEALKAKVVEARERMAGCYASKETKLEILVVLEDHDVTWLELVGPSRLAKLVAARKEVYRLLNKRGWSYSRIGMLMNRDHTSVMHGVKSGEAKGDE